MQQTCAEAKKRADALKRIRDEATHTLDTW